MSQEIDYPTKLKKFLWEHLKRKNEPLAKFEKRIEGHYFSDQVLDYPLLLQIMSKSLDINIDDVSSLDQVFTENFFNANDLFLRIFKAKAKPRLNKIMSKVNEIVGTHVNSHYLKNAIIFNLLSILYEEKRLKQHARVINTKRSAEIKKDIKTDLGSFRRSIDNLRKIFSEERVSSEKTYSHEYYHEKIINPIKEKAIELGLSDKMLLELAKFTEDHHNNEIAELIDAKFTYAVAKREQDYSELSRENMKLLLDFFKKGIGIPAEKAKKYIAELFDLFEIRPLQEIIRKFQADEDFGYKDAVKLSAKRISDVIHKAR